MVFIRLSESAGGSAGSAMSAGMAALDVFVNPAAARAREELDRQHEQVMPTPSPGDRMLDEGRITIVLPAD
ncbi:MAG: hypothetical protein Q8M17_09725 [Actinomycetota bacterium]|nr:hypothetical protein [Actinomycetota bacterium]